MQNVKAATATKPARKLSAKLAKPATAPAVIAAKPVAPVAAAAAPAAPAKQSGNVTRTIATVAAQRCNFGGLSDRDTAYLAFYAGFAKRDGGTVTVRAIAESGRKPTYTGSAKPHDAGVIQRLGKAGLIAHSDGSAAFTFTDKAKTLAAYTAAPVAAK